MASGLTTPKVLYGAATFLLAATWVFFGGVGYLFGSDVLMARWWRVGAILGGYAVLWWVTAGRPVAVLAWFGAGAAASGLSVFLVNQAWPLQNERSGGFLSGAGVVNYVFNPWLHTVLYMALRRVFPPQPRTADPRDAF